MSLRQVYESLYENEYETKLCFVPIVRNARSIITFSIKHYTLERLIVKCNFRKIMNYNHNLNHKSTTGDTSYYALNHILFV